MNPVAGRDETFAAEERQLRLKHSIIICTLGILLFPAGSALDFIVYPKQWPVLLLARLATSAVLGVILAFHFRPQAEHHSGRLIMLELIFAVGVLSGIIAYLDGPQSSYYLAIFMVMFAVAVLLPVSMREATAFCCAALSMYAAACLFKTGVGSINSAILNNLYFLALASVICVTAVEANARRRYAAFALKHEIELQNKRMAELDRLKSDFFANVSHELRTPLTLIMAPLQTLKASAPRLDPGQVDAMATIERAATRLSRLVDDILTLIRLDEAKIELNPSPVELSGYLRQTACSMRHIADARHIRLDLSLSDTETLDTMADMHALDKIVPNIIANAIKFTPDGGQIGIEGRREGDAVIVTITDTGIGIAPSDLPHVFERFYQAQTSSHRHQGLGLGLALAKELMERLGGRIEVASEVGRGTTITLTFPLARSPGAQAAQARPAERIDAQPLPTTLAMTASPSAPRARVLIVDDEPDLRSFLTAMLAAAHEVESVDSGPAALVAAEASRPDVVLLDYMLPGLNGLEVCKVLKGSSATRHAKVVMLTARVDEQSKLDALQCGADDFLTKPFNVLEVRTRVDNMARTAALERELRDRNRQLQVSLQHLSDTEAALVKSSKLNSLGTMAAGLLHEIGNPLNFMGTALQLADGQHESMASSDLAELLGDLKDGHARITKVVEDLREFTVPQRPELAKPFPMASAIEQALRFTAHARHGIAIETRVDQGVAVIGSKSSIIQVLVNLLLNAIAAVRSIETLRPPLIRITTNEQPEHLLISVWDNGIGIAPDEQSKIFDPFYTTKDVGEGMGLGLSICHRILINHASMITVSSSLGECTEFSFHLPLAAPHAKGRTADAQSLQRAF